MMEKKEEGLGGVRLARALFGRLGGDENYPLDLEIRQTNALEKIAKGYGGRRLVQEVALRETSTQNPQIYNLESGYAPEAVIRGLETIAAGQQGMSWAVTDAVRESAAFLSGGIRAVEDKIQKVVDVGYQIDSSINRQTHVVGSAIRDVGESVDQVDSSIRDQTQVIQAGMGGVSPDRKSISGLLPLTEMSEEEIIALGLKGILSKETGQSLLRGLPERKRQLVSQVMDYDPEFQKPLRDELESLRSQRKGLSPGDERDNLDAEIAGIEQQIREENTFLQNMRQQIALPVNVNSLRILARHGHLDRFVQDEAGEHIREVRTDVFGMNQSLRELLGFATAAHLETRQRQDTQIALQEEMIHQLIALQEIQAETNEILYTISGTAMRIEAVLREINEGIRDMTRNWLSHRRNERLSRVPTVMKARKFKIAIKELDGAEESDHTDPRIYILRGISHMGLGEAEPAEEQLRTALDLIESLRGGGVAPEIIDEFLVKIHTYLGRLHGQLALLAQDDADNPKFQKEIAKALVSARIVYEKAKNPEAGIDVARYLCMDEKFNEAFEILSSVIWDFPEITDFILAEEIFFQFKTQLQKKKIFGIIRHEIKDEIKMY